MTARPLDRADMLARVSDSLASGEPLAAADRAWIAEGLRLYMREAALGMSLETALGLAPTARGEQHWTTTRNRQRRDAAIRALGKAPRFAGLKITQAAAEIAAEARRFQHAGRDATQPRQTTDPETERLLTEALCTGQRFPGAKQIQSIIEM